MGEIFSKRSTPRSAPEVGKKLAKIEGQGVAHYSFSGVIISAAGTHYVHHSFTKDAMHFFNCCKTIVRKSVEHISRKVCRGGR